MQPEVSVDYRHPNVWDQLAAHFEHSVRSSSKPRLWSGRVQSWLELASHV